VRHFARTYVRTHAYAREELRRPAPPRAGRVT